MRNICLILCFITGFSTMALGQYKIVPKTGEGRFDRSAHTAFWPNYLFTHPSIFVSNGQAEVRPMRKWWREPLPPVLSVPVAPTERDPGASFSQFDSRATALLRPKDYVVTVRPELGSVSIPDGGAKTMAQRPGILWGVDHCLLTKQILKQLDLPEAVDFPVPQAPGFSTK